MHKEALETLIRTLEVRLDEFAVCKVSAGWRLNAAPTPATVLHFVLQGRGVFDACGGPVALERGMILIQPPHSPERVRGYAQITHEAQARENCRTLAEGLPCYVAGPEAEAELILACASIQATFAGGRRLFDGLEAPLAISMRDSTLANNAFEALLEEISNPGVGTTAFVEGLMKQTVLVLLRSRLEQIITGYSRAAPVTDGRLLRAVSSVLADPGFPHTLNSMAAIAGMSRSSFSTRFLQMYGQTPGSFLQNVRLESAAKLLRGSELPVKAVAAAVGYSSRSHFSRAFRGVYGRDPTAYRCGPQSVPAAIVPASPAG